MNDLPGQTFIPQRAYPRLRNQMGPAFFQGPSDSTPVADRRLIETKPRRPPDPFPLAPVSVTSFSAGNRIRLGVVGVLAEWWINRHRMSGQIFVDPEIHHRRIVARRQARVRKLDRLVASQQVAYSPLSYGEKR